jgi:hypothetical protein
MVYIWNRRGTPTIFSWVHSLTYNQIYVILCRIEKHRFENLVYLTGFACQFTSKCIAQGLVDQLHLTMLVHIFLYRKQLSSVWNQGVECKDQFHVFSRYNIDLISLIWEWITLYDVDFVTILGSCTLMSWRYSNICVWLIKWCSTNILLKIYR